MYTTLTKKKKSKKSLHLVYTTRAQDLRELYSILDKSGTFSPTKVQTKCISSIIGRWDNFTLIANQYSRKTKQILFRVPIERYKRQSPPYHCLLYESLSDCIIEHIIVILKRIQSIKFLKHILTYLSKLNPKPIRWLIHTDLSMYRTSEKVSCWPW
jgi:hypothetical protein